MGQATLFKVPAKVQVGVRLDDLTDRLVCCTSNGEDPIEIKTALSQSAVPEDAQSVESELTGTVVAWLDFCTLHQEGVGPQGGTFETEGHARQERNEPVQAKPEV